MGWDTPDVYNQPEAFDVEITKEVEVPPNYDFHKFVIWKKKGEDDGMRWWGQDSGCSCPSPFEDYDSLDKLEYGSMFEALWALQRWCADNKIVPFV